MGFQTDVLPWINGLATLVVAIATGVLAWREFARRREARRAADAEIKALASVLLRRIVFAFGPDTPGFNEPETDKARHRQASYILDHTGDVEEIVLRMAALAPEASDEVAELAREAGSQVLRGLSILRRLDRGDVIPTEVANEAAGTPREKVRQALSAEMYHKRGLDAVYTDAMVPLERIEDLSP